jgi:CheY-like chemotaxis protein
MDGREACRHLRKDGVTAPIILLTAQSGDADHVLGLRSGADDFLAKPISFVVLLRAGEHPAAPPPAKRRCGPAAGPLSLQAGHEAAG